VARAAVEPNWDLRSGKQGPMSQRGTSFGTNFGSGVSFRIGKSSSRQGFRVRLYGKTHTHRLSVQKIILADYCSKDLPVCQPWPTYIVLSPICRETFCSLRAPGFKQLASDGHHPPFLGRGRHYQLLVIKILSSALKKDIWCAKTALCSIRSLKSRIIRILAGMSLNLS